MTRLINLLKKKLSITILGTTIAKHICKKPLGLLRFLIFVTTLLNINSCSFDNSNKLEGHWHLYVNESDKYNQYLTLNIREDTIVDFDLIDFLQLGQEIGFLKNGKNIDTDSQFILLYDGMYRLYDYVLDKEKDRIVLTERDSITAMGTNYWGLRFDIKECDKMTDLFSREAVKISLPHSLQSDSIISLSTGFVFDILIGTNKITGAPAIQIANIPIAKWYGQNSYF